LPPFVISSDKFEATQLGSFGAILDAQTVKCVYAIITVKAMIVKYCLSFQIFFNLALSEFKI